MGLVGQMNHPRVREAIDSAIEQIVAAGRTAGTLVTDATVEHAVNKGVRFLQTHWPRWVVSGATTYLEMVAKATQ